MPWERALLAEVRHCCSVPEKPLFLLKTYGIDGL
jgi:hypothetical protein